MRRRRQEGQVELRKSKKEEHLQKRRNMPSLDTFGSAEEDKPPIHNLESIVQNSMSPDPGVKLAAVQSARKLLSSDRNPPIDELINSGILPILVQCLTQEK